MNNKRKKELFVQLSSDRLQCPLAPVMRQTAHLRFQLNREFIPRFTGYFNKGAPNDPDVMQIRWLEKKEDGSYTKSRKMGVWDFSTMDFAEITPLTSEIKLPDAVKDDDDEEEEEEDDDDEEDEDDDDSDSNSSSSDSDDNPKDEDYTEIGIVERLMAFPVDFNWAPESGMWEFKFKVDRERQCLLLKEVLFKVVKKQKGPKLTKGRSVTGKSSG